ncbi:N-acetylmuramoyl-L-alanine amidase [Marinicauda salina]|nr:N-acetylmuramoyl-L-alanine amidase [Marinicauda salina]
MVTMIRRIIQGGLAVAAAALTGAASASDITAVRFGEHDEYTRIVVETSRPLEFETFTLAEPEGRLVMSLPGARWAASDLPGGRGIGHGLVGRFDFDESGQAPRLIFALDRPALVRESFSLDPNGGGYRLVVDIEPVSEDRFAQASGFPESSRTMTELLATHARIDYTPPSCERVRVVIDPGHGGRDPGALAQHGGGDEADVNLAAARELRDLLVATGRYEVVMTRDNDEFVELEERIRIAQEADADLFFSIHADSAGASHTPRGAAVYTLADRAVDRARDRAIREGDWFLADRARPQAVNNLLLDMSLREKRNQSLVFAETLLGEVSDVAPLFHGSPRQRGLYVLLDSQVPAVLFEMGFLTNRHDARNLNDAGYRRRLMQAAASSIETYFERCGGGEQRSRIVAQRSAGASPSR